MITVIFSSFFVKETVVKDYAQPVIGTISGKVTKVSDGDTVTIVNNENKRVKVRLYGIDSPELSQDHGETAKQFLSEQVSGRYVTVDVLDIDQYKRSVGRIYIDDTDINRKMVEEGQAWVYPQYCKIPERAEWESLQQSAKLDKRGLWTNSSPTPPWEWRRRS